MVLAHLPLGLLYSLPILNAPQWGGGGGSPRWGWAPPSLCASGMFALWVGGPRGPSPFLLPSLSLGKWAPGVSAPLKAISRLRAGTRGGGCQPGARTQPFSKEKVKKLKKRKKTNIYKESYKAWLGGGAAAECVHWAPIYASFLPGSPFPAVSAAAAVPPPHPRRALSPLMPRAGGCGVHP